MDSDVNFPNECREEDGEEEGEEGEEREGDEERGRCQRPRFFLSFPPLKGLSQPLCFLSQPGPCRQRVEGNFRSEGRDPGGHNLEFL